MERCPLCGSDKVIFDYERGEYVCTECGEVLGERVIDQGPEWRSFDHEDWLTKVRAEPIDPVRYEGGVASTTLYGLKDSSGRRLSVERVTQMRRLSIIQKGYQSLERSLRQAEAEINRMSNAIGLPRVVSRDALEIFRDALKKEIVKGRSIDIVAAASVLAACRRRNLPFSLDEIAEVARADRNEIRRCYLLLMKRGIIRPPDPPNPASYISSLANKLHLSTAVQRVAISLLRSLAGTRVMCGKSPRGLAAAALYVVATIYGERRTQKMYAQAAGVTEVTVRHRVRELIKTLQIDVKV